MSLRGILVSTLFALGGLAASGDTVAQSMSVTCESVDGHERFCPADTRGGVALTTQLSKSPCRQGQTWGYDARGIWTSNGCRARFVVGAASRDADQWNSGRSSNQDRQAAAAAAAVALIAVGAVAAKAKHDEDRRDRQRDQNYGGGTYYDYRPPADYRYPDQYYSGRNSQTVRCESEDGRQRFCPADVGRARVEMTRQLSRTECRFARNWGYDRRGVWVNDGCRGEFTVYY